jgi:hypothetical protein
MSLSCSNKKQQSAETSCAESEAYTGTLLTPLYHTCGNQSAHDITEFCSVDMDGVILVN